MANLAELADNGIVVLFAYVAVFLPWTAVSATDFITAEWKTVRKTRLDGTFQLILGVFPIPYILFYIVLQSVARDYKELLTAIVGFIFSLLHIFRTAWGLWQLNEFQRWAASSILTFAFMGYGYENLSSRKNDEDISTWTMLGTDVDWDLRLKRAMKMADAIKVNETLVDNSIFQGTAHCYLQYYNVPLRAKFPSNLKLESAKKGMLWKRARHVVLLLLCYIIAVPVIVWEVLKITFHRNVIFASGLKMVPYRPVEILLHWATAFAAQGLHDWIEDFKVAAEPKQKRPPFQFSEYDTRRAFFAGQILAGAALHLREGTATEEGDAIATYRSKKGKCPGIMCWPEWDKDAAISNGIITKEELLREAAQDGSGLPFKTPQGEEEIMENGYSLYKQKLMNITDSMPATFGSEASKLDVRMLEWLAILMFVGSKALEKDLHLQTSIVPRSKSDLSSVNALSKDLKSASQSLHARSAFTVRRTLVERRAQSRKDSSNRGIRDLCGEWSAEKLDSPERNDIAFQTLSSQLGFPQRSLDTNNVLEPDIKPEALCAYPMMRGGIGGMLEYNRNVLKVSALVDIWCAIEAGTQLDYLLKFEPYWERPCSGTCEASPKPTSFKEKDAAADKPSKSQCELCGCLVEGANFKGHMSLEKARLEHQFSFQNHPYNLLDQTITFLGTSMEHVRSELAKWASNNSEVGVELWSPKIQCNSKGRSRIDLVVSASESLSFGMAAAEDIQYLSKRSVQTAILFELQVAFQDRMSKKSSERAPSSTVAIACCLMSFPTLRITARCRHQQKLRKERTIQQKEAHRGSIRAAEKASDDQGSGLEYWELTISPSCAPQSLSVQVDFTWKNERVFMKSYVAVVGDAEASKHFHFKWEWWRDAFLGRLKAFANWQRNHKMTGMEVYWTKERISSGIREMEVPYEGTGKTFQTWSGWLPFRFEIARFEMESDDFLLQYRQGDLLRAYQTSTTGSSQALLLPRENLVVVSYKRTSQTSRQGEARRETLRLASTVVREAIKGTMKRGEATNLRKKANDMLYGNPGTAQAEKALLYYELAVTELNDVKALNDAVTHLVQGTKMVQDIPRAVQLLERSCTLMIDRYALRSNPETDEATAKSTFSELKKCFEDAVTKTNFDPRVVTAFGTFAMVVDKKMASIEPELIRNYARSAFLYWGRSKLIRMLGILEGSGGRLRGSEIEGQGGLVKTRSSVAAGFVYLPSTRSGQLPSLEQAFFDKAKAEGSRVEAMYNLKRLLEDNGAKIQMARERVARLYQQAIDEVSQHDDASKSMYSLERRLREEKEEMKPSRAPHTEELHMSEVAEENFLDVLNNFAYLLVHGHGDTQSGPTEAVKIYRRAIERGQDTRAMNSLGLLLEEGPSGVSKDCSEALNLYCTAIDVSNDPLAKFNAANLLKNGASGVKEDISRAIRYYQEAVHEAGHIESMYCLAMLFDDGTRISRDLMEAKRLYERAMNVGAHVPSMLKLAALLESGYPGIQKDVQTARQCLDRAIARGGHLQRIEARFRLGKLLWEASSGLPKDRSRSKEISRAKESLSVVVKDIKKLEQERSKEAKFIIAAVQGSRNAYTEMSKEAMYILAAICDDGAEPSGRETREAVGLYCNAILTHWQDNTLDSNGRILARFASRVYHDVASIQKRNEATYAARPVYNGQREDTMTMVIMVRTVEAMVRQAHDLTMALTGASSDVKRKLDSFLRYMTRGWVADAMNRLGVHLENSVDGRIRYKTIAERIYDFGIACENSDSMFYMGRSMLDKGNWQIGSIGSRNWANLQFEKAKSLFEKAIDKDGNEKARFRLAQMYEEGWASGRPDKRTAYSMYENLASSGQHSQAKTRLGILLQQGGQGVPHDEARARTLFEQAIGIDANVDAMERLAGMLDRGVRVSPWRVERDNSKATQLRSRAAEIRRRNNGNAVRWW